jgi:thiamine pyrophosphate-dependent acetolactate synthase large subunit-like protein
MAWGSDAVAALLRELGFPYIALNPGASYRGLHDSLVNHLGNERPEMVVCLHEEHAVAVAHGYAKVTEQPLAVALHSNVGLMHATMALFNAFCDRVPMLVIGATGPVDAAERRPWIDWIHTAADQGALVRDYVKWDDQPASAAASVESIARGNLLTRAHPPAPVYVCLDAGMQEAALAEPVRLPDPERHRPPEPPTPSAEQTAAVAELLAGAARPLLLVGRVSRDEAAWAERVALAERTGARVLTDLKVGAGFPSRHPLHPADPGTFLTPAGRELVRAADVIVSLDWVDLAGTLRQAYEDAPVSAAIVHCSCDFTLHRGWSKDHFALPPVDVAIAAHPDRLVSELLQRGDDAADDAAPAPAPGWAGHQVTVSPAPAPGAGLIGISELAAALGDALGERPACLVRLPLGWQGADLDVAHPLDYLGQDGGAGLGSGPGMAVGAALALRDDERLAVAVLGDGDLLMGANALWTAARCRLPLLVVVANNRSFYNDEVHQERVALVRDRPVENRWVGQHIRDPDPDLAALARSLGLEGRGPISEPAELAPALAEAVAAAAAGAAVVVDVRVTPHGYPGGPGPQRAGEAGVAGGDGATA